MKFILLIGMLLVAGGYFYVGGGRERLEKLMNPGELPETIEPDSRTFMADHHTNPYSP